FSGCLCGEKVWPFSLQNDGFWEKRIAEPFHRRVPAALDLLHALVKVVMMRHSKSQVNNPRRNHIPGPNLVWAPSVWLA
ncbi:unnamed protein product, partial [Discosporangium mesarthrocarpum]